MINMPFKILKFVWFIALILLLINPKLNTYVYSQENSSELYISEVYFQGSEFSARDKWIEIYNPSNKSVSLDSYSITIGKQAHNYKLTNTSQPSIAPQSTLIFGNSYGTNIPTMLDKYSISTTNSFGLMYWLSNNSDDTYINISLLKNNSVIQDIQYNNQTTSNWLLNNKNTSIECTAAICTPSKNIYNPTYTMSPHQVFGAVSSTSQPDLLLEPSLINSRSIDQIQLVETIDEAITTETLNTSPALKASLTQAQLDIVAERTEQKIQQNLKSKTLPVESEQAITSSLPELTLKLPVTAFNNLAFQSNSQKFDLTTIQKTNPEYKNIQISTALMLLMYSVYLQNNLTKNNKTSIRNFYNEF
jgi:hypothetical protein